MKFLHSFTFPRDFNEVRKMGRRFTGKYGYGYILLNEKFNKFTISIPKKKVKLAVNRNLIRRRFQSAVRIKLKEINGKYSLFYVYNFSDILPFEKIINEVTFILENR